MRECVLSGKWGVTDYVGLEHKRAYDCGFQASPDVWTFRFSLRILSTLCFAHHVWSFENG
jgi:hypothetical protein